VDDLAPQPLPGLPAGEAYFHVWLQSQDPPGGGTLIPLNFAAAAASLVTSAGTIAAAGMDPGPGDLDAQLYFPVADSITRATLVIGATTVTATGGDGSAISYGLDPATIRFVTTTATAAPVPGAGSTGPTGSVSIGSPVPLSGSTGTSASLGIGLGLGALVVLGAGVASLVSVRRRRAFYRADRDGRITLVAPPLLSARPTAANLPEGDRGDAGPLPEPRPAILVKLLGWLEIGGTKQPVTAGPLQEIIVFLVLNPGRSFTSVQLRESIWGLGREPITSATFRKYMFMLRKAFGSGVVVTNRFHYEMTNAVTCDWDQFRAALEALDVLAGQEAALALVRGPVLHGSFDGKKNSPFAWAVDVANQIEDKVTTVAIELALACLDRGDALRATEATAQGLLCAQSNMGLRKVDLRVGAAVGGSAEVGRRLGSARAAMATFEQDMVELEGVARQLGWSAPVPG
jgi:hypothetical protein